MTKYFIWNEDEKIENEKIRNQCELSHNGRDDHMAVYRFHIDLNFENSDGSNPTYIILNGKKVKLFETLGAAILELPTIETGFNTFNCVKRYFVMPGEGRPDTEYKIEKMREALGGRYYIYSIYVPDFLENSRYLIFVNDPVLKGMRVPLFVTPCDVEEFVLTLDKLYCKYEVPSGDYITGDCSGSISKNIASVGNSFFKGLSLGLIGTCLPEIKEVKFNPPATIVFWDDDTKTVVKTRNGEKFDPEKGLSMAISKKALGNEYDYYETFKKEVGKYNKKMKKEDHTEVKKEIQKPKKSSKTIINKRQRRKTK